MPPLLERLGLSRHELAAAVSEAGGLGTIAVSRADAIRRELAAARALTGLPMQGAFGETGLLLALGGMLFCVGGAAIDSSFAASQFLGWEWGRYKGPQKAPRFTASWLVFLLLGIAIAESGINPVEVTEYSVVFSVVALPLTYLPVLLIAADRPFMDEHANGRIASFLGWLYFAVILVLALAAIPLLLAPTGEADEGRRRDLRRPPPARRADLRLRGAPRRPRRRPRAARRPAADHGGAGRGGALPAAAAAQPRPAGAADLGAGALGRQRTPHSLGGGRRAVLDREAERKAEKLGLGMGDDPERWIVRRLPWN